MRLAPEEYNRAAAAVASLVRSEEPTTANRSVPAYRLASAALDGSGVAERLAGVVESRDRLEGAYELVQREALLLTAQLRETNAELVDAIDRACAAEQRVAELNQRLAQSGGDLGRCHGAWQYVALELGELEASLPVVSRLGPRSLLAYHRARGAA